MENYETQPGTRDPATPVSGYPTYSGFAIASMVCGICAFWLAGVTSLVALPLGYAALKDIRTTGKQGRGMAIAGITCGWVCVGLWALFWAWFLFVVMLSVGAATGAS